jgi:hypothetical protein
MLLIFQEVGQSCVGIWLIECKIDCIMLLRKGITPGECIITLILFGSPLNPRIGIGNILPTLKPPLSRPPPHRLREYRHFHPPPIKRTPLGHIHHVESVGLGPHILNSEKEPLVVAVCIGVVI